MRLAVALFCLAGLLCLSGCTPSATPSAPSPAPAPAPPVPPEPPVLKLEGRRLVHGAGEFQGGEFEQTVVSNGRLQLVLAAGRHAAEGSYTSPVITAALFKELVGSWNALTPGDSSVELQFQVRKDDQWSIWLSLGRWGTGSTRASVRGQTDPIATMAIDTVRVLGPSHITADAFRYRLLLRASSEGDATPTVSLVSVVLTQAEVEAAAPTPISGTWERELEVPARSQMVEPPRIANRICSPTSLGMVMAFYGVDLTTLEVAEGVYDQGAGIYGNWPYNTAFAATHGLTAYVDFLDDGINGLKREVAAGHPVVCSIRTNSAEELAGAPMAYTAGHLLVVRGFAVRDGVEYVIVNDPAAPDHDSVRREYRADQFKDAWRGLIYRVRPGL